MRIVIGTHFLIVVIGATFCIATSAMGQERQSNQPGGLPNPQFENVSYGTHPSNVLDLWQARSDRPTPLVVFIHGGGFSQGDKRAGLLKNGMQARVNACLQAGISYASINYRLSGVAIYPAQMQDSARAVQFLRSKAKEWNLDPKRFAACGGSAGAGISMWLAFRDDLADPSSTDPVARESTRLTCAAVFDAQTSYDPRFIKQIIPGNAYRHERLIKLFDVKPEEIENPPPEKAKMFEDSSPLTHISPGDPPVYIWYFGENKPLGPDADPNLGIHHPKFGAVLKEKMDALKIECTVVSKGDGNRVADTDFLKSRLGDP